MRPTSLAMALLAIAGLAQAGVVEVTYIEPEKFTDAGRGRSLEEVQVALSGHLKKLGEKALPAQQKLTIEVLDVDLAGEVRPTRRMWPDTRVLSGRADWPQLSLRYTLREGDRVIGRGEDRLSDMNYLFTGRMDSQRNADTLPYEKRMLTEWFNQRFAPKP